MELAVTAHVADSPYLMLSVGGRHEKPEEPRISGSSGPPFIVASKSTASCSAGS